MVAFASESRILQVSRDEASVAVSGILTALQYESCPPGTEEAVVSFVQKLSEAFGLGVSINAASTEDTQWTHQ